MKTREIRNIPHRVISKKEISLHLSDVSKTYFYMYPREHLLVQSKQQKQ